MSVIDNVAMSWARSLSPDAGYEPPTGMPKAAIVWGLISVAFGVISFACAFVPSVA